MNLDFFPICRLDSSLVLFLKKVFVDLSVTLFGSILVRSVLLMYRLDSILRRSKKVEKKFIEREPDDER